MLPRERRTWLFMHPCSDLGAFDCLAGLHPRCFFAGATELQNSTSLRQKGFRLLCPWRRNALSVAVWYGSAAGVAAEPKPERGQAHYPRNHLSFGYILSWHDDATCASDRVFNGQAGNCLPRLQNKIKFCSRLGTKSSPYLDLSRS